MVAHLPVTSRQSPGQFIGRRRPGPARPSASAASIPRRRGFHKEAVFIVKAADEAALGDFKIKVIGKPNKGKEAVNTFELKIEKKG
jgi:hypothetical protein